MPKAQTHMSLKRFSGPVCKTTITRDAHCFGFLVVTHVVTLQCVLVCPTNHLCTAPHPNMISVQLMQFVQLSFLEKNLHPISPPPHFFFTSAWPGGISGCFMLFWVLFRIWSTFVTPPPPKFFMHISLQTLQSQVRATQCYQALLKGKRLRWAFSLFHSKSSFARNARFDI